MLKKLSLLLTTAAVLGLAAPALASAATGLTEGGKLVAVGTNIRFTNTGTITITSTKTGNISCTTMTLLAKLTTNNLTTVAGTGVAGQSSATNCTVAGTGTASFTNLGFKNFHTTGGGTGTAGLEASVKLAAITCNYSTPSASGTYSPSETSEGGGTVTFNEVALSVTPAACGTTAKLDGQFKMETDNFFNTAVWLM
jgi:hypothetical protein